MRLIGFAVVLTVGLALAPLAAGAQQAAPSQPRRMDLLKAAVPAVRRVGTIEHTTFGRRTLLSQMVQEAARALGIEALTITFVGRVEELDRAFAQAVQQCADAVQFGAHPFFNV